MTPPLQTLIALLVVLGAVVYLLRNLRRNKPGSSCGTSDGCACPAPKSRQPAHLRSRGNPAP